MNHFFCQIVALNKTKERMRPYQGSQEDENPDIKKIKKVIFLRGEGWDGGVLLYFSLSSFVFIYFSLRTVK